MVNQGYGIMITKNKKIYIVHCWEGTKDDGWYPWLDKELSKYNREHDIIFNIYMFFGQLISYSLTYILYTKFYNANILSIVVSILMFFLIISSIYLISS